MKKTILLLLVAVLSVATIGAQETKKAVYVIDGKHVKNFDGSQLEGKTIISWTITPGPSPLNTTFTLLSLPT